MIYSTELNAARIRAEKWHRLANDSLAQAEMYWCLRQSATFQKHLNMSKYCHYRYMKQIDIHNTYRKRDRYYTILGTVFCTVSLLIFIFCCYKLIQHG